MPRVGGGRSKKCSLGIAFVGQRNGTEVHFFVGFRILRLFELSYSNVAQLSQKLVRGGIIMPPQVTVNTVAVL